MVIRQENGQTSAHDVPLIVETSQRELKSVLSLDVSEMAVTRRVPSCNSHVTNVGRRAVRIANPGCAAASPNSASAVRHRRRVPILDAGSDSQRRAGGPWRPFKPLLDEHRSEAAPISLDISTNRNFCSNM
jgi:hypothetical protein